MWGKRQSCFCLAVYVTILNFVQCQTSETDYCGSDSAGYRYCESNFALCENDPDSTEGYVCVCPEGQSKVDGLCKDNPELTTAQDTETTSLSSSLSSTVSSNSGIENTPYETLLTSFETDLPSSSLQPIQMSSVSTVSLTTVDDYLGSTSDAPVSDIVDDDECLKHCSRNMTCIRLSHGLICLCKIGFIPHEVITMDKSNCIRNCLESGCGDTCRQLKCILPEDKKENDSVDPGATTGWPLPAILTCAFLGCGVMFLTLLLIYVLHKYVKTKTSQQAEENKVVYQKMNKGLHTESLSKLSQISIPQPLTA